MYIYFFSEEVAATIPELKGSTDRFICKAEQDFSLIEKTDLTIILKNDWIYTPKNKFGGHDTYPFKVVLEGTDPEYQAFDIGEYKPLLCQIIKARAFI